MSKKRKTHSHRILVAEDDAGGRELLKQILSAMKLEDVTLVEDGLAAWKAIETSDQDFDLVISDWNMPFATGLELLTEMRDNNVKTPFLMMTGRDGMDAPVAAKEAGVSSYIMKPFKPTHMMEKIKELLFL